LEASTFGVWCKQKVRLIYVAFGQLPPTPKENPKRTACRTGGKGPHAIEGFKGIGLIGLVGLTRLIRLIGLIRLRLEGR
jgi:hypothetical protein